MVRLSGLLTPPPVDITSQPPGHSVAEEKKSIKIPSNPMGELNPRPSALWRSVSTIRPTTLRLTRTEHRLSSVEFLAGRLFFKFYFTARNNRLV